MSELSLDKINRQFDKPAPSDTIGFPLFVEPTDSDFDDGISEEEKEFYKTNHKEYDSLVDYRIHCTACDRHLGLSVKAESRMRQHPMLRTLICNTCHAFYNSGEFEKGDDGSELYCRWCGQGGQVYCCSDCPHVFCAKCIKRNLGISKIKEIENTDDWKCFKCTPNCIWNLRALCWAVIRFCDLRTKLIDKEENPKLKALYAQTYSVDSSQCCKEKRKRSSINLRKSEDNKEIDKLPAVLENLSKKPTIQVKKFASMVQEEKPKEKKPQKRTASPKNKIPVNASVPLMNKHLLSPLPITSLIPIDRSAPKRPKLAPAPHVSYMRPVRPRPPPPPPVRALMMPTQTFNGYSAMTNMFRADNINLSLESLTQGLDMHAAANMNDDIVCTPDFPLEPLCEVTEEEEPHMIDDDDVECMTPPGAAARILPCLPPLVQAKPNNMTLDLSPNNIIQMTENDVNVNAVTGGLKFRVDPQTLSSNKMYRLPDGRIFAINANPSMPGGYSATIVAVTEKDKTPVPTSMPSKAVTYSAKLCAVKTQTTSSSSRPTKVAKPRSRSKKTAAPAPSPAPPPANAPAAPSPSRPSPAPSRRSCDLQVPVEWFRYNLIDAVDAIQYSLSRLNKMKKDLTTQHLRSRSVEEMRVLHTSLDRILYNSSNRYKEIKESLNNGMKKYLSHKAGKAPTYSDDDDDDDVEILNEESEPIFIDENSMESITETASRHSEVQCMELNDSAEKDELSLLCNEVTEVCEVNEDTADVNHIENNTEKENSSEETMNENSCASHEETRKTDDKTEPNKSDSKVTSQEVEDDRSHSKKYFDDIGQNKSRSDTTNDLNNKTESTNADANGRNKTDDSTDKGNGKSSETMETDNQNSHLNEDKSDVANESATEKPGLPAAPETEQALSKRQESKTPEQQKDGLLEESKSERPKEDSSLEDSKVEGEPEDSLQKELNRGRQEEILLESGVDREQENSLLSEDAVESLLQDDSDDAGGTS